MTCSHCKRADADALGLCEPCAAAAGERGRVERIAQGLPPKITDPAVYARLAVLMGDAVTEQAS